MNFDNNDNSPEINQALQEVVSKISGDFPADFDLWQVSKEVAKIGWPAVKLLLELTEGSDSKLATHAAMIIGELGDDRYIKLDDNRDINLFVEALQNKKAWAKNGLYFNKLAIAPIVAILDHENSEVRYAIAEALGTMGDPIVTEPLIFLLADKAPEVRMGAVLALEKIGDIRAIEPLSKILNDEDRRVYDYVPRALLDLEHSQVLPNLDKQFNQGSILIAHSITDFRVSVIRDLEGSGFEVISARSPENAENLLRQFYELRGKNVDLVICYPDMWLTREGSTLEKLQANPQYQNIPFVFQLDARQAPENATSIDTIVGPFKKDELLKKLPIWLKK